MTAQDTENLDRVPPTVTDEPVVLAAIEIHSIDVIPDSERHGSIHQQGVFWFLSNSQTLSVAVGFTGIALGLTVWWTIIAVIIGNAFGPSSWPCTRPKVRVWDYRK